jgi:recombination protein RecA
MSKATSKASESTTSSSNSALNAVLAQIQKEFGDGAIMRLGEAEGRKEIDVVSTGAFSLDMALGVGGLPRGRVVEIFGPESWGKPR